MMLLGIFGSIKWFRDLGSGWIKKSLAVRNAYMGGVNYIILHTILMKGEEIKSF